MDSLKAETPEALDVYLGMSCYAFYHFSQNNSFGKYDIDKDRGIAASVYIQAKNPQEANERAKAIGIYFDGIAGGVDCDCCGDRWSEVTEWDRRNEKPPLDGYGWKVSYAIHYADGTFTWHEQ